MKIQIATFMGIDRLALASRFSKPFRKTTDRLRDTQR